MSLAPRVALSQDFLLRLGKLPSAVHARIVKWALRFQQDPTATGINYETIKGARDSNLRSVRIDQDWRGIVFKPERGDLYILLHVDHHDDAYRWAERRKMSVNPVTGALQVVALEEVEDVGNPAEAAAQPQPSLAAGGGEGLSPPLFSHVSDDQLVQLGIPPEAISRVRRVRDEADLDRLQPDLPVEAYEALFLIVAGDSPSQILHERETRVDRAVDTADFATALETAESQSRFVTVTNDAEMAAILNAPLAQWRVFLHPLQRKLATGDRSGPVRVLGGAGTGKTVVAMHRARWLARNRAADGRKVLFTTFTRNLALDVEQNLKTLMLDDPALGSIEVINLDRWVHRYLRQHNYEHRIIYQRDPEAWGRALQVVDTTLDLDEGFYAEEWEKIVSAQGVQSLDDYRRVPRTGRRTVLSRSKRDRIWPVFEEYRAQLSSRRLKDVDDAYRDAAQLLGQQAKMAPYSAIVVDETQDFGPQALRLLRAMIPAGPNDLFFVGDGHQRIYPKHRAVLGRCGIDIRGRSRKLYLNYRTTDEIRKAAVALLEGREIDDLDGGADDARRYKSLSHGPVPEVLGGADLLQVACDQVVRWWTDIGEDLSVCVMLQQNAYCDDVARRLSASGIPTRRIDANAADQPGDKGVRIATMHRAKGLEFDRVVVVSPNIGPDSESSAVMPVYVALTRARSAATLVR